MKKTKIILISVFLATVVSVALIYIWTNFEVETLSYEDATRLYYENSNFFNEIAHEIYDLGANGSQLRVIRRLDFFEDEDKLNRAYHSYIEIGNGFYAISYYDYYGEKEEWPKNEITVLKLLPLTEIEKKCSEVRGVNCFEVHWLVKNSQNKNDGYVSFTLSRYALGANEIVFCPNVTDFRPFDQDYTLKLIKDDWYYLECW